MNGRKLLKDPVSLHGLSAESMDLRAVSMLLHCSCPCDKENCRIEIFQGDALCTSCTKPGSGSLVMADRQAIQKQE